MSGLGIVAALPREARSLGREPMQAGVVSRVTQGVDLILSGIGAERAARSAGKLLEEGATALLSWGIAAGLDPALVPGSIILPSEVIGADGTTMPVDAEWRERVRPRLSDVPAVVGRIAEAPKVLGAPAEKQALARATKAIAADMESAAIARLALLAGVPFLAVRAVADPSDMALPPWLLAALDESGRPRVVGFLAAAVRHRKDLRHVARIAFAYKTATLSLSTVRERAGPELLLGAVTRSRCHSN
jgi:adenosylhomocysteine nucleosidase